MKADGKTPVANDTVLKFAGAENSKKYDFWGAYMSESGSLMGVLEDGIEYDGVPPGMDEVMGAAYNTIGNILSDDNADPAAKQAALKQLGEDLSSLTYGLYELFTKATADAENAELSAEKRATAQKFVDSFKGSVERAAKSEGLPVANVSTETTEKTEEVEVLAEGETEEQKAARLEKEAKEAAAKADKELSDKIAAAVAAAVAPYVAKQAEAETTIKTLKADLARAPARRSVSEAMLETVDEPAVKAAEAEASRKLADARAMMGIKAPRSAS